MPRFRPLTQKEADWLGEKIKKIMIEGVRGKRVSSKQAVAIAFAMLRKKRGKK